MCASASGSSRYFEYGYGMMFASKGCAGGGGVSMRSFVFSACRSGGGLRSSVFSSCRSGGSVGLHSSVFSVYRSGGGVGLCSSASQSDGGVGFFSAGNMVNVFVDSGVGVCSESSSSGSSGVSWLLR